MRGKFEVWEAACTVTGYSVGSGIMALPWLLSRAGLVPGILVVAAAFFFNCCLHLLLAELCMGARGRVQLVAVFADYVFRGRPAWVARAVALVLVVLALVFSQAGFLAGGSEVLGAAGLPGTAALLLFYAVAAAVVLSGLRGVGVSEALGVGAIAAVVAVLALGSLGHGGQARVPAFGPPGDVLAFFGMAMFAFVAFFSVPQVVTGLDHDAPRIRHAIVGGLGMNLVFVVVICACALSTSPEVTEVAIVGWSRGIGPWAQVLGSVFTVLAMLTTYWSLSLACSDMIGEQFGWGRAVCWAAATLPGLLVVLFAGGGFVSTMRVAGSLIAVLIAVGLPIVVARARHDAPAPRVVPRWMESTPALIMLAAAFALMAVGSMV